MATERSSVIVQDPTALAEMGRVEDLQQRALQVDNRIRHLLAPLRDQLSELVVEYDRLFYEALAARQKFFQLAKKADPGLALRGSLRYEKIGEQVHIVWDETGPRFSEEEHAELPRLHRFEPRAPDRRASDLLHWLR